MEHKTKFQALKVPLKDGTVFFLYYKLFTPDNQSLYTLFTQNKNLDTKTSENLSKYEENFPNKRTMLFINFDRPFQIEKLKKLCKSAGRTRNIFISKSAKDGKQIYYAIVVFNKSNSVNLCLDHEWFQNDVFKRYKLQNIKADFINKQFFKSNLLSEYGEPEIINEKEEKMKEDGFTIVSGNINNQNNEIDDEDVIQKKKKKPKILNDFYRFQIKNLGLADGENELFLDEKDLLKKKKRKLLSDFLKDQDFLISKKTKTI